MIVPLRAAVTETCGGKAGALGALLRAGLPVPDGFVVPFADPGEDLRRPVEEWGDAFVAVRSSASDEDTAHASAAGQYESFLAVRGTDAVIEAVRACRASLLTPRALDHRGDRAMAVLIQRHLDAEVSGVMFTPADPHDPTRIEASWGLGPSVVGGTVTPDTYLVAESVTRTIARKRTRLDRRGGELVTSEVPLDARDRPAIDDATAQALAGLGRTIAAVRGGPQDIEWAIAGGRTWILQARPITAAPPPLTSAALNGMPGSHGVATGTARIVRGPGDFARVRPGDILICPFTDPAWTPLLRIAAGVVTETGGVLSHAAIVARERGIPAVLGIQDVTNTLHDGATITIDGTTGTIT
ncbi:PEP/pyruvate-binding domain-containing protein [Nonomuraea sp. NPDC049419]|uniref:PEP/pyruvate-binding domain-containing protein n=1 Tax=Nonomuraea sp. NPDC049419 TaxID=3155772 RepID=UPI00344AF87B